MNVDTKLYCRPIFRVADIRASVAYYVNVLGFAENWCVDDGLSKPVCAQVTRATTEIILWRDPALGAPGRVFIVLCEEKLLDALHEELRSRGARITEPPASKPWGYGIRVEDLDGNQLVIIGEAPARSER